MICKKIFPSVLIVTLMSVFTAAHAGLIIESEKSFDSIRVQAQAQALAVGQLPLNKKSESVIVNIGKIPSNLRRLSFDMSQKSVGEVLAAIAPKGWSGYTLDPNIKAIENIGFYGNSRQWPVVLKEILQAHGMIATVNWNKREIAVSAGESGVR